MTPKMVANFRRSLSFPNQPSSSSSSFSGTNKPKKIFHVRSTSLPCRSHPLIFQLKDSINELKAWAIISGSEPDHHNRTSDWLRDGLSQLKLVHESLDDLLQLPQTRESLLGHYDLIEKFLEDFLHFVDVYGIFQSLILRLKEEHLAAQIAVRRRDDSKISFYLKTVKKLSKEIGKLVSAVQCIGKYSIPSLDGDAELAGIIRDVIEVTVTVSVAVFNGISISLSSRKSLRIGYLCLSGKKVNNNSTGEGGIEEIQKMAGIMENLWNLRRKKGEEELKLASKGMNEMEDCICGIEIGSERAFRSLISTRVSLLNVLTH
ncbi:hypothetical protein M9H77_20249 [Catharanthus roseus]|uniref:Uncharacterized protein n=1 Tax=Catharanthus roseus TaxID=4058 RepID=A0ACC0AJN0_CATRO|nr:hypothetical protein M9H77_20249 [Catharanthus roseus]